MFVDHPTFLERVNGETGAKLYGPEWGQDATRLLSLSEPWSELRLPEFQPGQNPFIIITRMTDKKGLLTYEHVGNQHEGFTAVVVAHRSGFRVLGWIEQARRLLA